MTPHLLSGGAAGADSLFAEMARRNGHKVTEYHFDPKNKGMRILDIDELQRGYYDLKKLAKKLGRRFPCSNPYATKLISRNWWQVLSKPVDAVYAVADISKEDGLVQGGTGWACHLYLEKFPMGRLYVFAQNWGHWVTWSNTLNGWYPVNSYAMPEPTGVYTGIGSRKLTPAGINAIRYLYKVQ